MNQKLSAGILAYRYKTMLEVLLVHPGGPFWKNKDDGAWSIPKGLYDTDELPLDAAIREFKEETGINVFGNFIPLKPVKTKSSKIITAFAVEFDCDVSTITSNTCLIEWPPKSKNKIEIPEVDKAQWFFIDEAKTKINVFQKPFLDELDSIKNQK